MKRIQKLAHSLIGVEGCLIEEPEDLFYLTGLSLSLGRLWVSPNEARLFVDGRYFAKAKQQAPCPVSLNTDFKGAMQQVKRASFDSAFVTYDRFITLKNDFPHIEWVPVPNPVKNLRLIKDAGETESLRKAAQLTWKGYQHILKHLKEGIAESELALEFEIFCRKNGASGLSFQPIVAFGENSAYPHYRAGAAKLQKNQIVLIDVGA